VSAYVQKTDTTTSTPSTTLGGRVPMTGSCIDPNGCRPGS
jgi:hypothetical protein